MASVSISNVQKSFGTSPSLLRNLGRESDPVGPYLDENDDPIGSMIIMRAENQAVAEAFAKADPFYREGGVRDANRVALGDWFMNRPDGFIS